MNVLVRGKEHKDQLHQAWIKLQMALATEPATSSIKMTETDIQTARKEIEKLGDTLSKLPGMLANLVKQRDVRKKISTNTTAYDRNIAKMEKALEVVPGEIKKRETNIVQWQQKNLERKREQFKAFLDGIERFGGDTKAVQLSSESVQASVTAAGAELDKARETIQAAWTAHCASQQTPSAVESGMPTFTTSHFALMYQRLVVCVDDREDETRKRLWKMLVHCAGLPTA